MAKIAKQAPSDGCYLLYYVPLGLDSPTHHGTLRFAVPAVMTEAMCMVAGDVPFAVEKREAAAA